MPAFNRNSLPLIPVRVKPQAVDAAVFDLLTGKRSGIQSVRHSLTATAAHGRTVVLGTDGFALDAFVVFDDSDTPSALPVAALPMAALPAAVPLWGCRSMVCTGSRF